MASAAAWLRRRERASERGGGGLRPLVPPSLLSLSLRPLVRSLCSLCVPILRNGGQTDALPSSQSVGLFGLKKTLQEAAALALSLLPDCVWRRGEEEGHVTDQSGA